MADVVKMANPLRLSASGEPSQGGAMASMDPKSPSRGLNPIPGGVKGGTRRFDVDGDGVPDVDGATKFSGRKLTDFEKSALKEEEALLQMSATETELRMSGKAKRRKGTCCVLCSCRGTVLTALLQDGEETRWYDIFMLNSLVSYPLLVYWIVRMFRRGVFGDENRIWAEEGGLPQADMEVVGSLGGLLFFFLVFFASQTYTRFEYIYEESMKCQGRIFDALTIASHALTESAALRLFRHLNAAHVLGYVGLTAAGSGSGVKEGGGIYTVKSLLIPVQRDYQILDDDEWHIIEKMYFEKEFLPDGSKNPQYASGIAGGSACRHAIAWALQDVEIEVHRSHNRDLMAQRAVNYKAQAWSTSEVGNWIEVTIEQNGHEDMANSSDPAKIRKLFEQHKVNGHVLLNMERVGVKEILASGGVTTVAYIVLIMAGIRQLETDAKLEASKAWQNGGFRRIETHRSQALVDHITELRRALAALYSFMALPVPFFYVHLLYLTSAIYLPLFAYVVAMKPIQGNYELCEIPEGESEYPGGFCNGHWGIEVLGMAVVLLSNIVVIGLSKVCEWLADPYGSDVTDLNVRHFIQFTLDKGLEILKVMDIPSQNMSRQQLWEHERTLRARSTFGHKYLGDRKPDFKQEDKVSEFVSADERKPEGSVSEVAAKSSELFDSE